MSFLPLSTAFNGVVRVRETRVVKTRVAGDALLIETEVMLLSSAAATPTGQVYTIVVSLRDMGRANQIITRWARALCVPEFAPEDLPKLLKEACASPLNNFFTGHLCRLSIRKKPGSHVPTYEFEPFQFS